MSRKRKVTHLQGINLLGNIKRMAARKTLCYLVVTDALRDLTLIMQRPPVKFSQLSEDSRLQMT